MPADKFFIAPYDKNSGLINAIKPFMIPDKAFSVCNNAYVWRERLRKRFGSHWLNNSPLLTRLRMSLTPAVLTVTTPSNIAIGQQFSIGSDIFTVNSVTFPVALLSTSAVTAQLIAANQVTFSAIASTVYWYPSLPVMGLVTLESASVNDESLIAFDTKYAYSYSAGWNRIAGEDTLGAATWAGSNSQFFWGYSYGGTNANIYNLYVTNFNQNERMRYLNANTSNWDYFTPQINATPTYLASARILIPFKNRLVAFDVWESPNSNGSAAIQYPFRARWCKESADPIATDAWREDIPGNGNGLDAPTLEAIITAEFVRDRLIVFFERSTYEFIYNSNQVYPFAFQQINTELGAESTFSVVPFDQVALAVGNLGIMACNGTNVDRIDGAIPDEVFKIHLSDDGPRRVYGIRDFYTEMVWWTFPDSTATSVFPYPKRVLVYNYKNATWSFNDDSITAFGYFQPTTSISWSSEEVTWDDSEPWDSGPLQAKFRKIVAGNQQGWTFIIDTDKATNASVLQITDIVIPTPGVNFIKFNCIDFNLNAGDFIYIQDIKGTGNLTLLNNTIQNVIIDPSDPHNFFFSFGDANTPAITGTYAGGGTLARVSKIDVATKAFNFYQKQGRNASVNKIDFLVDTTDVGQILVDWYVSTNGNNMVEESGSATGSGSLLGTSVLETSPYLLIPFEQDASQVWHAMFISAQGEYIQLNLYFDDVQMKKVITIDNGDGTFSYTGPTFEDFQLHAMVFTAMPTGRLQ